LTKKIVDESWVTSTNMQCIKETGDGLNKEDYDDDGTTSGVGRT